MINLMPPNTKKTLKYARRNRVLMHWVTTCAFFLVGGLVLIGGGWLYLNQQINETSKQIATTQQSLNDQHLASVQKQVTDMSNNLKLTVQVLSKEILFSELLTRLGSVTPNDVVLTNLDILQTSGSIDITAEAKSYASATQLQANLADPKNSIFSQADIENVSCKGGDEIYPCQVTIRALFASDNPFLFINTNKKAAK